LLTRKPLREDRIQDPQAPGASPAKRQAPDLVACRT